MNSTWSKAFTVGIAFGLTLCISVLFVVGWKAEKEWTETGVNLKAFGIELTINRVTKKEVTQGSGPVPPTGSSTTSPSSEESSPYVGGNYVSKSTIRYVVDDDRNVRLRRDARPESSRRLRKDGRKKVGNSELLLLPR